MDGNGDRGAKDRIWVVDGRHEVGTVIDPKTGEVYGLVHAQELADLASDVATVVRMVGGTSSSIAERIKDASGVYRTTAVVFKWSSYAPQARAPRVEPVPRVEFEDEPAYEPGGFPPAEEEPAQEQLEDEPVIG